MDFKTRDKDGMKPSLPILQKIQDVKSMSDFQQLAHDFMYTNYALPFSLTVEADAKDGSQKQLVLRQPEALLQSPDLYKKSNEEEQTTLDAYRKSATALLKQAGKSDGDAEKMIEAALKFDRLLSEKNVESIK
ncbi:hypothetical protein [uncultured Streptococcus sp.]|uniref:hypothetical protein n=1 Tax=uncultured Streptococcus sp. TaxID=83427 RepID=UPI0027DDAC93|nr:hypothetical protein [uncultured Streptococcus sp.]